MTDEWVGPPTEADPTPTSRSRRVSRVANEASMGSTVADRTYSALVLADDGDEVASAPLPPHRHSRSSGFFDPYRLLGTTYRSRRCSFALGCGRRPTPPVVSPYARRHWENGRRPSVVLRPTFQRWRPSRLLVRVREQHGGWPSISPHPNHPSIAMMHDLTPGRHVITFDEVPFHSKTIKNFS